MKIDIEKFIQEHYPALYETRYVLRKEPGSDPSLGIGEVTFGRFTSEETVIERYNASESSESRFSQRWGCEGEAARDCAITILRHAFHGDPLYKRMEEAFYLEVIAKVPTTHSYIIQTTDIIEWVFASESASDALELDVIKRLERADSDHLTLLRKFSND